MTYGATRLRNRFSAFLKANLMLAGIVLMLGGLFLFSLNDAMGKWLLASYSLGQVLVIRSLGSFLMLAPMLARQPAASLFRLEQPPIQGLRIVVTTCDLAFFYAALTWLPLADVMTFYMAAPIYVTAISHFVLGERISWQRWLAVLAGFAGVIFALRPSPEMLSLPSLLGIAASFCYALTLVTNRLLRNTSDTTLVTWQTVAALATGLVLVWGDWKPTGGLDLVALLLLGVISGGAHLAIARSMKLASAALLAPLQYTLLLWAIVLGWLFFGDLPDRVTLIGGAIIMIAGLFIYGRVRIRPAPVPVLPVLPVQTGLDVIAVVGPEGLEPPTKRL